VVIFFATSILAYIKDYRAMTWAQDRTAEIKTSTRELIAMNREVESNIKKLDFLYEFRNGKNRKIDIVSELSNVMPRDAWLTSLSADENGKIEIGGFARRAADIIGPIERSDLFENVEFSSPVTVSSGLERFSLKMRVEEQ
jgi:Tfp pilus assembly protein PilN